jgi:hypothetical protein
MPSVESDQERYFNISTGRNEDDAPDGFNARSKSNPDFLLGAARPRPPGADIGPGGQSVGQAVQFCLGLFLLAKHGAPATADSPDGSRIILGSLLIGRIVV